jgi:glycosyltransferase involved in cell wall biosynthesis
MLPNFLRKPLRLFFSFSALVKDFILKRDVVRHVFLPEAYLLTAIAARFTFSKSPLIMSRRSLNNYQLRRPILGRLEKIFHKYTTLALGNSKAVVDQLYLEGFAQDKVGLIYNGINTWPYLQLPEKKLLREKFSLADDTLIFIIVANLIPYKGHSDLLNAFALISPQIQQPWQLLCVGRDNGIMKGLKTQAVNLGIADNVKFLGSRNDTMELMAASDVGILCSHEEGFSNAILEGMAAGLAMVVTDVGGNAEAVLDMYSGFVVPAKNPELLGQALLTLALSQPRREHFQNIAKERVQRFFSLNRCIEQYVNVYKTLLVQ